jgi:DegV family protein with EDD domain
MALAAAEAASKNASSAEIVTLVEETGKKIHTFVMLPTLKYLALGGRVDKKIAMLADTINIKPILTVRDGKLDLFEKVRTHKKAVERLLALVANVVQDKNIVRLAVIHVNEEKRATEMESLLRNAFSCPTKITITELTPGLSVHTGSGVVGIVVQTS